MKKALCTLCVVLSLVFPTWADESSRALDEAERLSRLMMDGTRVTKDLKLPLDPFPDRDELGAWITPEGFLIPTELGYVSCRWPALVGVIVEPGSMGVYLGIPEHPSLHSIRTSDTSSIQSATNGGPLVTESMKTNLPFLPRSRDFEKSLVAGGGLELVGERGQSRLYRKGKVKPNPQSTTFFPLKDADKWKGRWSVDELKALAKESGVTLNRTGMAVVSPLEVKAVRWKDMNEATFQPGAFQNQGAQSFTIREKREELTFRSLGLRLRFPEMFCLSPYDLESLNRTIQAQISGTTISPPESDVFFPMYTNGPEWVDAAKKLQIFEGPETIARQADSTNFWPNNAKGAGLFLLPEGLLEIDRYTIRSIPWEVFTVLDGSMEGSIAYNALNVRILPRNLSEVATFRQARREVIALANLSPTSMDSPSYVAEKNRVLDTSTSGVRYPLSEDSAWHGLPFSVLGAERLENGLYIRPEGLLSVQDHIVASAPWSEIEKLQVDDYSESPTLTVWLAHGRGGGSFPPNTTSGLTNLKATKTEVMEAIETFVGLDAEGSVTSNASGKTEAIRFDYEKAPW